MNMLNIVSPLFCRQSNELIALQEELRKAKTELSQVREELAHNSAQKDKINSQVMHTMTKQFLPSWVLTEIDLNWLPSRKLFSYYILQSGIFNLKSEEWFTSNRQFNLASFRVITFTWRLFCLSLFVLSAWKTQRRVCWGKYKAEERFREEQRGGTGLGSEGWNVQITGWGGDQTAEP